MTYKYDILENTEEGIVKIGEKEVYNLDSDVVQCSEWVRKPKIICDIEYPQLSSPLKLTTTNKILGCKKLLGYFVCDSNIPSENDTGVGIVSSLYSKNKGLVISAENFYKNIAFFCSRRLTIRNVWNDKDEYMKPSDTILASDEYKQWNNDCVIYSLFDNQSFQSSLRQIDYQNKKWDIINEFFWLSSDYMRELAESINWVEMIDDIDENGQERFVYTEIDKILKLAGNTTFSTEALDLLFFADQLVKHSFKYRKFTHNKKDEYHLQSWDCGYAQLKLVWKEYMKEYMKTFLELRNVLANKLRPKVYEFGFLHE